MADKIEDLQGFYAAVENEVITTKPGSVGMWGKERAISMLLGDRILGLKRDEINEREYIERWGVLSAVGTLDELDDLINGRGRWGHFGKGITTYTYPNLDDGAKRLHAACLELERQGKIARHREDGVCVVWMPINGKSANEK